MYQTVHSGHNSETTTVVNTMRPNPSHHLADKDALAVGQQQTARGTWRNSKHWPWDMGQQQTLAVGQQQTLAVGQQQTLAVGQQQTLAVGHGTTANSSRDLSREGLCPASALSLATSRVCP